MSNDYDVKAINEECSSGTESISNTNPKNSGNDNVSNSLGDTSYQSDSNNKYDTVSSESVKPLYGGKKNNKYKIEYENYKEIIYGKDEKKVILDHFRYKKINKDIIINVLNKSRKNKYIIRNNKSNNICKINY